MVRCLAAQVGVARDVVSWYLATHYGKAGDVGLADTFTDSECVGHFAVERRQLEAGKPDALFRLLVTVAMFQRLRDSHVMGILRGISTADAHELTSAKRLVQLCATSSCPAASTNERLLRDCDLTKDPNSRGVCSHNPDVQCHLKGHTELLRRYGHFGKVPSSAALVVNSVGDLRALRDRILLQHSDPTTRARALEAQLMQIWRVRDKIAAMYLSLLTVRDLGLADPPWANGVDATWFVVVDQNVDAFLRAIDYDGPWTYEAKRAFIRQLSASVDLSQIRSGLASFNPRLVQQAMYLFMSSSNRRRSTLDCSHAGMEACRACAPTLRGLCPVRIV